MIRLQEIFTIAGGVTIAVAPLVMLFLVFQVFLLKLPLRQVADILRGTLIAALGLFLFLVGVSMAFLPFGRIVGAALGKLEYTWIAAAIGALLGFVTAWGEPAVRILADQVEEASNGSIRSTIVLLTIAAGVAFWVGVAILRITYGISLLWLLIPGYAVVIVLLWLSDRDFVSIAADAGGVATGPLANSFLLALALGASAAVEGQDPIAGGFGLVALVALAPIMSLMMLGVLVRLKTRK